MFTNIRKNYIHIVPKYFKIFGNLLALRVWQDGRGTPPWNGKHVRKATTGQPPWENHEDNHPRTATTEKPP
jgi:hypothetical protein